MTSGLDLERYLAQFTDTPRMRVTLDLAAVTFIDTAGLRYITDAAATFLARALSSRSSEQ